MCASPVPKTLPTLFLLGFAYLSLSTADRFPGGIGSLWGLLQVNWMFHSVSILWLEDHMSMVQLDTSSERQNRSCVYPNRIAAAAKLWNNPRLLGTSREVPGVEQSSHTPSRYQFAILRAGKLAAYWVIWFHIQPRIFPGPFLPINAADFDAAHETYLRRLTGLCEGPPITLRETQIRCIFALLWAWGAVAMIDASHCVFSLAFVVCLRVDEPSEWPPIFGSILEAYNLRRFWGRFWHRTVIRSYRNCSKVLSQGLLFLEPGSPTDKAVVIFTIFLLAGTAHATVAWQLGDRCGRLRDIWWFCLNFAAGALEVILQRQVRLFAQHRGLTAPLDGFARGRVGKTLGFAWVFAFFFWSVPKWQYAKLDCAIQDAMAKM